MTMRLVVVPNLAAWADAIVALEVRDPLPARVVLVPMEAHAHALRRELAARAPQALIGTRFLTPAAAARATLDAAGIEYRIGEEARRPLRVRAVLRRPPKLGGFRADDLASRGWEEAFASTIEQLELAGLEPSTLARVDDPRAADLAAIWRAVDDSASTSWTAPRFIREAAERIEKDPSVWPFDAHVLASVTIGMDPATARFVRAIPRVVYAVRPGRPARRRAVERIGNLLGPEVAEAIARVDGDGGRVDELGLLHRYLFEAPARLADLNRPRSRGPDGSVEIEQYAGVNDELDAAARWVAERVFDDGLALGDIAVLVPAADPLAALVADRIGSLPWPADVKPVYIEAGRPATTTAAGARLLALVRALLSSLARDAMLDLVPRLRPSPGMRAISPSRARIVIDRLATLGGSPQRPERAAEWLSRAAAVGDDPLVTGLIPAFEALTAAAAQIHAGAPLGVLWRLLRELAEVHLRGSEACGDIFDALAAEIEALATDPIVEHVTGPAAFELIAERLCALRLHEGRYGDPSVFVGTLASAAGLQFAAVRIVGLAEGRYPGTLRLDALVSPDLRDTLPPYSIATDEDYTTGRLHVLDQVVRGCTRQLVFSAPRTDGGERDPASVFVEVAAALARPNASTGAPSRVVPTMAELERDAFAPARSAMARRRALTPLTASCWIDRVAQDPSGLPSRWLAREVTSPVAMLSRASAMDGLLGPAPLAVATWGTEARPFSASALHRLLACPQRFLLEYMLGWRPRRELASDDRIAPAVYGKLVHAVLESFARDHGTAFGARDGDLESWLAIADALACGAFDTFKTTYPWSTDSVIDVELRRLRRDIAAFIDYDWSAGLPRTFVAAEREFGTENPVAIDTALGPMFVAGRIDRIDVEQGVAVVRDLKTGRAHPRERDRANPRVESDVQIALYAAVARQLASEWGIPDDVAAGYVYVQHVGVHRDRAFIGDRAVLAAEGQRWLDLAMELVRAQTFVKTPAPSACTYCPFSPVCGDDHARTAALFDDGHLAVLRDLER
jgi:hypothetical protein